MEVKLLRVEYTVCPGYRKFGKKQITFYWLTKEGERVNLLPEALCTCIPLFPVSEREEQEGRKRERDRKSTQGSNDNKQIMQERRSLWTFPVRKSAFFFFPVLALSFPSLSFASTAPLFSPEISFQRAKPCKNRPRVFKAETSLQRCPSMLRCTQATAARDHVRLQKCVSSSCVSSICLHCVHCCCSYGGNAAYKVD